MPASRFFRGPASPLDLALAIVGNPELLFLDEPTTGFDPAARRRSWEAIAGFAAGGTTIVLTTHYLEETQQLADRVIVLSNGSIVASGSPDDLGDRHAGTTTIRFRIDPARAGDLGVETNGDGAVETSSTDPVPRRPVFRPASSSARLSPPSSHSSSR